MNSVTDESAIRALVHTAVESYATGFQARHEGEVDNPNGTLNMKIHNVFIAALGPEIQYYTALVRSLDSSLGNMLERLAINIADLFFDVKRNVEGPLSVDQTRGIAELLENYKRRQRTPSVEDCAFLREKPKFDGLVTKRHDSDYYLIDPKTNHHHLIELKIGGDLDNKKARSEKEALLEQLVILSNTLPEDAPIHIHFATAYNRFGEGKPWKQERVRQYFADDELLTARFIAEEMATAYHLGRIDIFLPYFADIPVVQLTPATIAKYRRWRHSQKKLKDATINRDLSVFRRILNWGVEARILAVNPLVKMPLTREPRVKRPVLSLKDEKKLILAASVHLKPIIRIALDTGMRRGEIFGQLWEDIDFDRKLLYVSRSKTPEGEAREIPLTDRVCQFFLTERKREGLIFTFRGKAFKSLKTTWKTSIRKAGIRYVRFHDLRHTFNTRLMEAGVMREIRMALMGHSGGRSVHSIYTHVELPAKRKAIEKLQAWVCSQSQEKGGSHDRAKAH